ncbi:MAG TPA: tryptophan--tRNA ligase [Candidatus Moranbacteria bacterium]|nr:tryptophan--tRNA ligase [Candidatus Moranbacteria bacterium]HAT75054.1 tryptophan--tRNA ligase [Candidatus Moranbacteria bacterium]
MKQRIFSGIQPSGNLHIGNYLGAIQNWVKLQDEFDSIFCVVDMHAITVPQNPEELKKRTIEVAKIYLAAGIDPKKCVIFIQSHISEHAELCWILNAIARNSDLMKMTQFKDKTNIQERRIILKHKLEGKEIKREVLEPEEYYEYLFNKTGVGLFDYPVLMAADILLYGTQIVPVGKDQKQHIELARDLAKRFNKKFGETFIIPEAYTKKESENIMGLDDPSKKMSKSASSEYNYIALSNDEETVRRKIKKAVTDSGSEIIYSDEKPALKNLINIYSLLSDKTAKEAEELYKGKGYADFKNDLAEVIITFLKPLQARMRDLSDEKVLKILEEGAKKARPIARKKLDEVKKKIGFVV